MPRAAQRVGNRGRLAGAHVDRGRVGARDRVGPRVLRRAGGDARRREGHAPRDAALRERHAELGARGERGGDARYDLERDARVAQGVDLFLGPSEQHRIASFQPHDDGVLARRVDEALVDEALRGGMPAAALADREPLGAPGERERVRVHQRVVEHDVGPREEPRRAQREEVGRTRAGADEIHLAGTRRSHHARASAACRTRRRAPGW